ncbi:hypothetical protein [Hymenobacter sp. UYCo722]|uniref:hypothetical protein n=1 Tax=Hymenobacter sp. UYCo722 TaxID=3156335 RepID=UPI003392E38E
MEFNVLKTLQFGGLLLVLYDWMAFPNATTINNLYAYNLEGERLWIAEAKYPGDFFVGVAENNGQLIATTWSCFSCLVDPETGKTIKATFTK